MYLDASKNKMYNVGVFFIIQLPAVRLRHRFGYQQGLQINFFHHHPGTNQKDFKLSQN